MDLAALCCIMKKQQSGKSLVANSPPRKAATKGCTLRAALPHGMPLVRNLYKFSEYIPEVCRRLEGTSSGDIIVVTGYNDLGGIGKTSVLAGVVQEEEVQRMFCAMFWMNLGAYSDDADLFGATKVLAIDVYFTLRNLIESTNHDAETVETMNRCGKILADLDTLESVESVLKEVIGTTKRCLTKHGYGNYCPLLVLDDLWNQRLLLLLRETGFTILVTTRYANVLEEDQISGCCFVLDPLPTESCLRLFFSLSPIDRAVFEKLPSSRDLVRLCSTFITAMELSVLAGITHHWNPAALPMKLPAVLKKREKLLSSPDKLKWIDQCWEENAMIFSDNLTLHRGLMTTFLLSIEMLDELAVKCYLSMVAIPPGVVFDFDFLRCLWDLGSDEIVKSVLDLLVSRHLVAGVMESPPLSSRQRHEAASESSRSAEDSSVDSLAGSGSSATGAADEPIPTMMSFEDSIYAPTKLEGLYQLHGLHSDFLMLCALNFSSVAGTSSSKGIASVLSFFESSLGFGNANWRSKTFSPETNCNLAITQSCDRAAGFFASKDLLLQTDPSRLFLHIGYWRRLELLNKLGVWRGLERTHPQHPCIIPYLQQRIETEIELEGIREARSFMTRACMMLELVNSKHHYIILEEWYRRMLKSYPSDLEGDELLEQARLLNCLGDLLVRRGQPADALVLHRKALLIYPQFVNETGSAGAGGEPSSKKRSAEKGMLTAMEHLSTAITLIPRGDPSYDPQALVEAAETQRLVVRMKLNIYGSQHVGLGASTARLAEILCAAGMYNEAIVEHEKALKLFAQKLGTNHPLYQSTKGEYGISQLSVVGSDEDALAGAISTIQEAVVWLLHHGVSWDDRRIVRLKKHLPPDNIEYLTESIVGIHYIRRVGNIFPMCGFEATKNHFPMCGLEGLLTQSQECLPVYDTGLSTNSKHSNSSQP